MQSQWQSWRGVALTLALIAGCREPRALAPAEREAQHADSAAPDVKSAAAEQPPPQAAPMLRADAPSTREAAGRPAYAAMAAAGMSAGAGAGDPAAGSGGFDASEDGGTETAMQAPTCTQSLGQPGESQREIESRGTARSFLLYVPRGLQASKPVPLVLVFHGAAMTGRSMRDLTGFERLADEHGFIVVFPEGGKELTWNIRPRDSSVCGIGELFTNPDADDFGFVQDMLDSIAADHCIDRSRVFATGFSMGGYFSNHLACQHPELVRAAAPHSSGTYRGPCRAPVPMLIIHSSNDVAVDAACGIDARDLWLERNGCRKNFDRESIKRGHCDTYRDCRDHKGDVVFCQTDDVCHAWSGRGNGGLFCPDFGSGPTYEDATTLIWRFFAANL